MEKLILASNSPRRRDIFTLLGLDFEVIPSAVEPAIALNEAPEKAVLQVARAKAADVFQQNPARIVVGADTVVVLEDRILGKPASLKQAEEMLTALSGRHHRVMTGVSVLAPQGTFGFTAQTTVWFYPLSLEQVRAYAASGEAMDKAGAYAIQGNGLRLVEKIDGDFYNVVGFPAAAFVRHMQQWGLSQ